MEKTFPIKEGTTVEIEGLKIKTTGDKGTLERDFTSPLFRGMINIERKENNITVSTDIKKRKVNAMVGTIAAHIRNMMRGVSEGFIYKLKIVYVHFPFTMKQEGNKITIVNFLGGKANRSSKIVGDSKVEIKGEDITVTGINREDAGQTSANLETATKVRGRDRRIFNDGIFLVEKP